MHRTIQIAGIVALMVFMTCSVLNGEGTLIVGKSGKSKSFVGVLCAHPSGLIVADKKRGEIILAIDEIDLPALKKSHVAIYEALKTARSSEKVQWLNIGKYARVIHMEGFMKQVATALKKGITNNKGVRKTTALALIKSLSSKKKKVNEASLKNLKSYSNKLESIVLFELKKAMQGINKYDYQQYETNKSGRMFSLRLKKFINGMERTIFSKTSDQQSQEALRRLCEMLEL